MRKSRLILVATTAVIATASPFLAMAQTGPQNTSSGDAAPASNQLATVIVTARKRSEDLLKVPVAVSALTAKDLAARDIDSMQAVADFSPGLSDDQSIGGTLRTDRSFQQLIIRGLNPSSTLNPTTSIFINGTPVSASDFIQNLDDVDRVEVLKGPQSAYFGRETFAGAVNVVAKSAGNTLGGDISADVGTRNTQKYSVNVNVPIIDDKLAVRAGYTYDTHDGSYENAADPGQTLGDQTTKSVHATVTAKPIQNLTIKAYGLVFQDHDGPAATGILLATPGKFDQGNCTVAGTPYFCGTLPKLLSVSPAADTTIVQNVNYENLSRAFLADPGGLFGTGNDFVNGFGLKRNAYHGDLNVEYDLPSLGLSLTYLGAYNHDNWSEISDLGNEDTAPGGQYPGTAGFPFAVENSAHDVSHEVRIATDQKKRFRALIGASYVDTYNVEEVGTTQYGTGSILPGDDSNSSRTIGVFFALAYDILPQLTLNFDGRYQTDKESINNITTGATDASGTSSDFLPRVSLQYKITPDVMSYFTYSKGVNPGTFNPNFSALPTASQNELKSLGLAGGLVVKPEDITNYELGVKGRFFNNRASVSADIYYDKWTNQLVLNQYLFAANDPANPYNVVGSTVYQPGNTSPDPYGYTDNSASSTAKGLEVDADFIVVEHVTVNLSGAINDTQYDKYICIGEGCAPYTTFNAKGKYLPNSPKDSFSGGIQYSNTAPIIRDADWFARLDYIYRDGFFIQPSNTVKTPAINIVNIRAGLNLPQLGGHVSIEGYVNNLFNNKSYTSGSIADDVGNFYTENAVQVGLPQLITGGVRLKYAFR